MDESIETEAERYTRAFAAELTAPEAGECLPCYLERMLRLAGCDGSLRWARVYRDTRAPQATALERRLGVGGGFCDCEALMNVYRPAHMEVGPCTGVRRGSTQPCEAWLSVQRAWPYGAAYFG